MDNPETKDSEASTQSKKETPFAPILSSSSYQKDLEWFNNTKVQDATYVLIAIVITISTFFTGVTMKTFLGLIALSVTLIGLFVFKMVRMPRKLRHTRLQMYNFALGKNPNTSLLDLAKMASITPKEVIKDLEYGILHSNAYDDGNCGTLLKNSYSSKSYVSSLPASRLPFITQTHSKKSVHSVESVKSSPVETNRIAVLCEELNSINKSIKNEELQRTVTTLSFTLSSSEQYVQGEKGFHFLDLYVQGALDLLIEYCSLAAENPESLPDLLKFLNIIIVSLHDLAIEQEEMKEIQFSSNVQAMLTSVRIAGLSNENEIPKI